METKISIRITVNYLFTSALQVYDGLIQTERCGNEFGLPWDLLTYSSIQEVLLLHLLFLLDLLLILLLLSLLLLS